MSDNAFKDAGPTTGLTLKTKIIIISVVVLLGLAAVYLPKFVPSLLGKNSEITTFQTTPNPQEAYTRAHKGDKPIFVEFYAKW